MILAALVVTVLIAFTALYVAGEFAAVGARESRVQEAARGGSRRATAIAPLLHSPDSLDHLVAACQVGITATSLILGAYGQAVIARNWVQPWLGDSGMSDLAAATVAVTSTLVVLTALQVLFGELVPKAIALRHPEEVIIRLAVPVTLSVRVMGPAIRLFNGSAAAILRALGRSRVSGHAHLHDPDEIELLVTESRDAEELSPSEHRLIANALELGDLVARQVMIPRNQLVLGEIDTPVPALLARIAVSSMNGAPIYEGSPDNIVGFVQLKRLLGLYARGEETIDSVLEPIPFFPETVAVTELWQTLVQRPGTLAVVLDEYGGTAGVVTRDRLVGEVIGETLDEFDPRAAPVTYVDSAVPLVRGDLPVVDVNELFGLDLPTDRADSIGGLIVDELGRIAQVGDQIDLAGASLRVASMHGKSIEQIELHTASADDVG